MVATKLYTPVPNLLIQNALQSGLTNSIHEHNIQHNSAKQAIGGPYEKLYTNIKII